MLADRATATSSPPPQPQTPVPSGGDPWEDEKWTKYKWTIYRGVAYDLTPYLNRHPGGRWLLNLAVGRDATGLFESYHLRPEVAALQLKRLPVLEGFPVEAVPRSPYPSDSELYCAIRCGRVLGLSCGGAARGGIRGAMHAPNAYLCMQARRGRTCACRVPWQRCASPMTTHPACCIPTHMHPGHDTRSWPRPCRERVRTEVFKGTEVKGAHRSGSEGAAFAILGYAAVAYALFLMDTNPLTGALLGEPLVRFHRGRGRGCDCPPPPQAVGPTIHVGCMRECQAEERDCMPRC